MLYYTCIDNLLREYKMETKQEQMNNIWSSLVNGQRKQMVRQIDEYGLYDFWADFKDYLHEIYSNPAHSAIMSFYSDAVISYFRIKKTY